MPRWRRDVHVGPCSFRQAQQLWRSGKFEPATVARPPVKASRLRRPAAGLALASILSCHGPPAPQDDARSPSSTIATTIPSHAPWTGSGRWYPMPKPDWMTLHPWAEAPEVNFATFDYRGRLELDMFELGYGPFERPRVRCLNCSACAVQFVGQFAIGREGCHSGHSMPLLPEQTKALFRWEPVAKDRAHWIARMTPVSPFGAKQYWRMAWDGRRVPRMRAFMGSYAPANIPL